MTSIMNLDGASVSEAALAAHETRDIVLPNQNEHVAHIAVDVKKKKRNESVVLPTKNPLFSLDWWIISEDSLFYFCSK